MLPKGLNPDEFCGSHCWQNSDLAAESICSTLNLGVEYKGGFVTHSMYLNQFQSYIRQMEATILRSFYFQSKWTVNILMLVWPYMIWDHAEEIPQTTNWVKSAMDYEATVTGSLLQCCYGSISPETVTEAVSLFRHFVVNFNFSYCLQKMDCLCRD